MIILRLLILKLIIYSKILIKSRMRCASIDRCQPSTDECTARRPQSLTFFCLFLILFILDVSRLLLASSYRVSKMDLFTCNVRHNSTRRFKAKVRKTRMIHSLQRKDVKKLWRGTVVWSPSRGMDVRRAAQEWRGRASRVLVSFLKYKVISWRSWCRSRGLLLRLQGTLLHSF